MASSTITLLALMCKLCLAMPWAGPQETKVYDPEDFSPRPTTAPEHSGLLVKRDFVPVNVCGWFGGRAESVARCGSGSSCIHDTMFGVVGCCATAGPCTDGVFTSCIDSGKEGWSTQLGMINNGVLSCGISSTCYQNAFPGGYKQFSCGTSNAGDGTVQTTYDGQGQDVKLQVVYTGIRFSPMSRPALQTVPFSPDPTAPSEPNPSSTQNTGSSGNRDESTGYIAGGTIGGVAVAAILIAAAILCMRRRKKKGLKVGGIVNFVHRPAPKEPSGPLKRLSKLISPNEFGPLPRRSTAQDDAYMSPNGARGTNLAGGTTYLDPIIEDNRRGNSTTYISPLTGHPDESHAPGPQMREQHITVDRDLLMSNSPMSASTYNGGFPEMDSYDSSIPPVPISRLNVQHSSSNPNSREQSPRLLATDDVNAQQRQPLVGIQIDDFGSPGHPTHTRNWSRGGGEYANINQQQHDDTHIHSGHMPEMTDIGLIGTMRRAASQMVKGNSRTQDKNVRSESMRQSNPFSDDNAIDESVWKSTPMNAPVLKEPEGFGLGLGFGGSNWGSLLARSNSSAAKDGEGSKLVADEGDDSETSKVERPLMEQMMEAFNAATRGVSSPSPTISSASAATRHGGMYAVPEELEGSVSEESSSVKSGVQTATMASIERPTLLSRGTSSASLLRKPVGGSVQGHRHSRSEI